MDLLSTILLQLLQLKGLSKIAKMKTGRMYFWQDRGHKAFSIAGVLWNILQLQGTLTLHIKWSFPLQIFHFLCSVKSMKRLRKRLSYYLYELNSLNTWGVPNTTVHVLKPWSNPLNYVFWRKTILVKQDSTSVTIKGVAYKCTINAMLHCMILHWKMAGVLL